MYLTQGFMHAGCSMVLLGNHQTVFDSDHTVLQSHHQCIRAPISLLCTLAIRWLVDFRYLNGCMGKLTVALVSIFLVPDDAKHLHMYLLAFFLKKEMSIQILYQVEKFVFMNIYPVDCFLSCLLSFLKKKIPISSVCLCMCACICCICGYGSQRRTCIFHT